MKILMYNKGQAALIGWIFLTILGLMVYFIGAADIIGDASREGVQNNNLTGIEALFYSNINWFIAAVYLLLMLIVGRFMFS